MAETLVLVPTYNEFENLERTIGRLRQAVPHADVLIIDDASPDGTGKLAASLAAEDAAVSVLHRSSKSGFGSAAREGMRRAIVEGYRFVAVIDADGSHDSDELPALIAAAAEGADLVIGSRWISGSDVKNWAVRRRLLSNLGNRYARTLLKSEVRDLTAGFRVYRTAILAKIGLSQVKSEGYAFNIEMTVRIAQAAGHIVEIPAAFTERALGASKMVTKQFTEALGMVTTWGVTGVRAVPRISRRHSDTGEFPRS
ncbi:glycosyltransferase [Humidisolicoccus flavus]|uniref:glycosyltransferase n=1 Tax=Humidisolicoccus flavus TaxID=3111414 RepID=UPI0032469801